MRARDTRQGPGPADTLASLVEDCRRGRIAAPWTAGPGRPPARYADPIPWAEYPAFDFGNPVDLMVDEDRFREGMAAARGGGLLLPGRRFALMQEVVEGCGAEGDWLLQVVDAVEATGDGGLRVQPYERALLGRRPGVVPRMGEPVRPCFWERWEGGYRTDAEGRVEAWRRRPAGWPAEPDSDEPEVDAAARAARMGAVIAMLAMLADHRTSYAPETSPAFASMNAGRAGAGLARVPEPRSVMNPGLIVRDGQHRHASLSGFFARRR